MKKLLVILLAFALVFGLVLTACQNGTTGTRTPPPPPPGNLVEKVVFELATDEGIQALTVGKLVIGNDLPKGTDSPIKPLQEAGEGDNHVKIEAVKGPGDQKIALTYETVANWGAGIDLPHASFGFTLGDKITVTGEVLEIGASGDYVQPNFKVGSEDGHGFKETAKGPFEWEIELDASMLADIKGGGPAGIRLDGRKGGQKVQINNIKIVGLRPSDIKKLAAPVIALDNVTGIVSWAEIEGSNGYDVLSGSDVKTTVKGTSINLLTASEFEYETSHTVTVVAVGTAGSTSDSDPSNAVVYAKPAKEIVGFNLKVNSATQKVEVDGVKGTVTLLTGDTGYTFKNNVEGSDLNYGNAYGTFAVDLGAGKTLKDVATITCKFKGIAGDIGWKTGGVRLNVRETAWTGYQSADAKFANNETISDSGKNEIPFTFTIKTTDANVTALTAQKLYFIIYIHGNEKGNAPDATSNPGDGLPTEYSIYDVVFTVN